jgi:hypothetical protein
MFMWSQTNGTPGMVLFYCTAVAMKHQDQATKADGLLDLFEPGEHIAFSGYVII